MTCERELPPCTALPASTSRSLEQLSAVGGTDGEDGADAIVRRHDLIAEVKALPPLDRKAVLLVTWHDLTNADAAAVMDCSVTAFAVRLHRVGRRLARNLHTSERAATYSTTIEETP